MHNVLVVYDPVKVNIDDLVSLKWPFTGTALPVMGLRPPFQVFDIDDLPKADMNEIRKLVLESAHCCQTG